MVESAAGQPRPSPGGAVTVKRPFFFKIALVIATTVSVSLALLGWVVLGANEATLEDLARSRQHLALEDVTRSVEGVLRASEDVLEVVGRVIDDTPPEQADAIPMLVASIVSGASSLDAVGIYDVDGERVDVVRERGSSTELPTDLDEETRDFSAAQGSLNVVLPDGAVLSVVPLRVRGEVTGYVAGRTSLVPVARQMAALGERHFGHIDAPLLLIDASGRVLAGAEPLLAPVAPELAMGLEASRTGSYAEILGDGDDRRLVTIERMELRPFRVVVSEPTSVVFASVAQLRRWIVTSVLIGILVSFAVAWALGRRLARPIAALVTQADHLAHRRFDRRVEIDSGDELALLGRAMSDAAGELSASEERIQREVAIRNDLGRYLPGEIVDRVVAREQDMHLGGERRDITVLFADVVGFTPLTEKLAAEDTVKLLNELFSLLTEIVFRHGGTIDKFMGDSVMAIFGAPTDQPDHAARALACAEDMLRFLDTGNAGWSTRYDTRIELAIGVASGECVVGNIGSERRMEYTAIGDVVNTAARLEAIARPNQILVSEGAAKAAGDGFDLIDRGDRELPGKRGTLKLYEVSV